MNPLETRSLPHGLWQFVPNTLIEWDLRLQQTLEASIDRNNDFWGFVQWLTASSAGIVRGLALLGLMTAIYAGWKTRGSALDRSVRVRNALLGTILLLPFLGASDLCSSGVKYIVGRLKPHVNFYNPSFVPALSLPSNHAFNSAFAISLLWFALESPLRPKWRRAFAIYAGLLLFVGLTRVLFGQHYPIDVLTGWILGALLGRGLAPYYRRWSKKITATSARE